MGELNRHFKIRKVHLKSFAGSKAQQLIYHTLRMLEEHLYDAAWIHVGINNLLKGTQNPSIDSICNGINYIALRCGNHSINKVFISSIAYSTEVNSELIQQLNEQLYEECIEYRYHVVGNGAVSNMGFLTGGIHLESSKIISAKNLIGKFNFLGILILGSKSCQGKRKILFTLKIIRKKNRF